MTMKWMFNIIIFGFTAICIGSSAEAEQSWFDSTKKDSPEHDCSQGPGTYPSLYYQNRWYTCDLLEGRKVFMKEEACSSFRECYNASQFLLPKCAGQHCTDLVPPLDMERSCHIRKAKGPFPHPTDRTRLFGCKATEYGRWDFDYDLRCPYGMIVAVYTSNNTLLMDSPNCCNISDCGNRVDEIYSTPKFNLTGNFPKPSFPEMPDDFTLWDDMLVPTDFMTGLARGRRRRRNAVSNKYRLWTSANFMGTPQIPYYIDESLDRIRPNIYTAMRDFHAKTCIRFIPWTPANQDYIYLFLGDGCYSFVGNQRTKGQQLSLNPSCNPSVGVIIHELNHAVGFYHEHTRSDRDEYLDILWDNIAPGHESNWSKLPNFANILTDNFTTDTVMIYSSLSASKDGVSPTMLAKGGQELPNIELSSSLTEVDARRINALYSCP